MKHMYPLEVTWFMLATLGAAFLVLISGSPAHRENDPLFWFMVLNVLGLLFLSILLHHEKREGERETFIRMFFLMDWLLGVAMAGYVIWRRLRG
jgi:hypothetical protein